MKKYVNILNNKEKEYFQNYIKLEDTVIVIDGSYMLDAEEKRVNGIYFNKNKEEFELLTVIGINKPYPTAKDFTDVLRHENNCKIKGFDGKIYYCSLINIRKYK